MFRNKETWDCADFVRASVCFVLLYPVVPTRAREMNGQHQVFYRLQPESTMRRIGRRCPKIAAMSCSLPRKLHSSIRRPLRPVWRVSSIWLPILLN